MTRFAVVGAGPASLSFLWALMLLGRRDISIDVFYSEDYAHAEIINEGQEWGVDETNRVAGLGGGLKKWGSLVSTMPTYLSGNNGFSTFIENKYAFAANDFYDTKLPSIETSEREHFFWTVTGGFDFKKKISVLRKYFGSKIRFLKRSVWEIKQYKDASTLIFIGGEESDTYDEVLLACGAIENQRLLVQSGFLRGRVRISDHPKTDLAILSVEATRAKDLKKYFGVLHKGVARFSAVNISDLGYFRLYPVHSWAGKLNLLRYVAWITRSRFIKSRKLPLLDEYESEITSLRCAEFSVVETLKYILARLNLYVPHVRRIKVRYVLSDQQNKIEFALKRRGDFESTLTQFGAEIDVRTLSMIKLELPKLVEELERKTGIIVNSVHPLNRIEWQSASHHIGSSRDYRQAVNDPVMLRKASPSKNRPWVLGTMGLETSGFINPGYQLACVSAYLADILSTIYE
jgi:hypothetical protein